MKELNITEGPWKWVDILAKGMKQRKGLVAERRTEGASILFHSARFQVSPDDAQAIVTAVNNTYHKGIDPEGVPELVDESNKALEKLHEFYYDHFVEKGYGHDAAEDRAQISTESLYQALKKAGVNINKKAE